uniref:Cytoplasmic FMR1-interacting protein n=1 Tax=Panagrellus redivivus TaxID=6233 RepID=A0A7E4V8X5_PANRE
MDSGPDNPLTLKDAITNVQLLDDLPIFDDQPIIEGFSQTLGYKASFDTNFEDGKAYITGCSKYIEEATRHGYFNQMLQEGLTHAGNLYTWRCCSRSAPMAKSNDQANRCDINEAVVEVLHTEVDKLYKFMVFTNDAITQFCNEMRRLCHPEKRKDFVSESYLLILGKFMNMFAILDELKNMKASIKNDFSTYRRAVQSNHNSDMSDVRQLNNLSLFLATQNKIKDMLQTEVKTIDGYEELLADVINICATFYENRYYVSPDEKHMYVKVIAIALLLIDSGTISVVKLDQKKRISISRLDKIFKSVEVVPLFGDMQVQPFSFVKRGSFYDASKWPLSNSESETCHVNIAERVKIVRQHHDEFVAHLARIKNETNCSDKETSDSGNREITALTLSGLQLLCSWTSDVVETVSWKLLHPTDPRTNSSCPPEAESYERATRYNYSADEKSAMIQMIAYIKGVQALLGRMNGSFSAAIRKHIYAELQEFVRNTLKEPMYKALKNKKDVLSAIMTSIIETCIDDCDGRFAPRMSELSLFKSKKSKKSESTTSASSSSSNYNTYSGPPTNSRRVVSPSSTQLYMARTMLESLISDRGGKKLSKKDIDLKFMDKMVQFHRQSYHWPALLELTQSVENCCDLSQLWFREFYLEMTMGARIQFPIAMSIPWILTDHILTTQDPALIECILFQLDLYNDAANYSLRKFKKKFLYDECEAEVNLCFDQFVVQLSDAVYIYYKQLASCYLLDKGFKQECTRMGINIRTPPAIRFEVLLNQRHFQLLGRMIDLNRLVSQRINETVEKALDNIFRRFDAEPLSWIMNLEQLIEVNRLCHRLMSEELKSLGHFNDLFIEANHQVYSSNGRITLHAYQEIMFDIVPNFCYNTTTRRFVRTPIPLRKAVVRPKAKENYAYEFGSKSLNAAFANICNMYSKYIGAQHLQVLARLIGYRGITTLLEESLANLQTLINDQLKEHVRVLFNIVPKICKLPRYDYGSEAVFQYYMAHLKDVIHYPQLEKEFCQVLREIGNTLLLCMQLETALAKEETTDLFCAATYTNVIPKPAARNADELEHKMRLLESKYNRIQIGAFIENNGTEKQARLAFENNLLTTERLCIGLNVFDMILTKVKEILISDTIWKGSVPPNSVMWVDECVEFHRVWSAVQFAFCLPVNQQRPAIEEIFGDGPHFAGCTLIRLLGQWRRFEVFDFSYHFLRIFRTHPPKPPSKGKESKNQQQSVTHAQLTPCIERIRRIQSLNNQLFAILGNYMQHEEQDENIREYPPPMHPNAAAKLRQGPLDVE